MADLAAKPFFLAPDAISWVRQTIGFMSIEEKIGQLFVPIGYSGDPAYLDHQILRYHVGGIMYRCGEAREMQACHRYLQEHSKVPLLIGANLENGGIGIAAEGTAFGSQMQAAATGSDENAYRLGKVSCTEGKAVGCNWAFAPVVDIDMNWRNPITNVRTYGVSAENVLRYSLRYLQAAQEEGVAACAKHFPGDGVDEVDQHILTSVNQLSCAEWDASYGKVYQGMIDAGVLSIMAGHIAMPAYQRGVNPDFPDALVPATLSPELLQGLLRNRLGFNGLIVTDSTCMVGFSCAMPRKRAVPYAIEAGCDMFLFNKDLAEDYAYMMEGYRSGVLSEARLQEALERILGMKAALGLHTAPAQSIVPPQSALSVLSCEQHTEWARHCASKAITLVKDTQQLLPLHPNKHRRVLLEILGQFDSNARVIATFSSLLQKEGFDVDVYTHEDFGSADFSVSTFREKYNAVVYLANIENASNQVTNRLSWFTFWGNGNNVPWFVKERPVLFISVGNPYHLVDVPMVQTYINCYANHDAMLHTLVEKILGREAFHGVNPIDPFCGKQYLAY